MVLKIPTYDKLVTRENEPPYWSHAGGGSLQVIVGGDSEDRLVFDPAVPGSGRPWPVKGTGRGQGTAMTHPGRVPGRPHPGLATPREFLTMTWLPWTLKRHLKQLLTSLCRPLLLILLLILILLATMNCLMMHVMLKQPCNPLQHPQWPLIMFLILKATGQPPALPTLSLLIGKLLLTRK